MKRTSEVKHSAFWLAAQSIHKGVRDADYSAWLDVEVSRAVNPMTGEWYADRKDRKTCRCIYCDGFVRLHISSKRELSPDKRGEMEHIVPVERGGDHAWDNLVPACKACNDSKGVADAATWIRATFKNSKQVIDAVNDYREIMQVRGTQAAYRLNCARAIGKMEPIVKIG